MSELLRPRLLLLGEPAARPDGLERALVRSGFQVLEADRLALERVGAPLADAILLTAFQADDALARELAPVTTDAWRSVPRIAVLASDDPDQVVAAITLGADDALAAPVRPAELRARLEARLRACAELRRLREAVLAQRLMFDVFQDICASLRPDEVLETLVRRVGEALGVPRCSFVLTPPGERYGRVLAVWETPTVADLPVDLHRYPEVVEAVRSGQPVLIDDVATDPRLEAARRQWEELGRRPDLRCVAALPCGAQGRVVGVLLLRTGRADPPLTPEQVDCAYTLARATARVLESEQRREAIYRRQGSATATDPLTGCGSLDALDRRIRDEFERARRYALSFSLVLLDVDRMRLYNERFGNAGGDRLLAELGALLQRELRAPDFISRYGGDEFALILPETDLEGARRSVTRVRQRIAAHPFPDLPPQERPRVSAGIVTYPHPSAVQIDDLFALVEAALLRGKAQAEERIGTAESVAP